MDALTNPRAAIVVLNLARNRTPPHFSYVVAPLVGPYCRTACGPTLPSLASARDGSYPGISCHSDLDLAAAIQ